MDFKNNSDALDRLFGQHTAFTGKDNPNSRFVPIRVPIENFQKAPQLTKDALGDDALDEVAGVMGGDTGSGVVSLFTGNSPGAVDRAEFLSDLLSNFPTFYSWMKAYIDIRETGFIITHSSETNEYLAIGPGFQSLDESAYAVHENAAEAFRLLNLKLENEIILHCEWTSEQTQFARDVTWSYTRSHPDQPGVAIVPDSEQKLLVTGRWTKPGTRYAVSDNERVSLDAAPDSTAMILAKQLIVEQLWESRERAGGQ